MMTTDRVGFEPTVPLYATQLISSQPPSASRAPVQDVQFTAKLLESFPLFMPEGRQPSFDAKPEPERVGIHYAGSAPRLDADLATKVAAIKARETTQ